MVHINRNKKGELHVLLFLVLSLLFYKKASLNYDVISIVFIILLTILNKLFSLRDNSSEVVPLKVYLLLFFFGRKVKCRIISSGKNGFSRQKPRISLLTSKILKKYFPSYQQLKGRM